MKNSFLAISLLILFPANHIFAACLINEDWSDAPCFDALPVNRDEYREAWAPYYNYKGSEWMEQKKAEMFDAKDDGRLVEWADSSRSNHNVFYYYHSRGEVSFPPQYDRPFFEDDTRFYIHSISQGWSFFVIIGASVGLISVAAVFIVRRVRK